MALGFNCFFTATNRHDSSMRRLNCSHSSIPLPRWPIMPLAYVYSHYRLYAWLAVGPLAHSFVCSLSCLVASLSPLAAQRSKRAKERKRINYVNIISLFDLYLSAYKSQSSIKSLCLSIVSESLGIMASWPQKREWGDTLRWWSQSADWPR